MRRIALAIGTAGGVGLVPVAPGTAGSAVGVVVYLLVRHWSLGVQAALILGVCVIGVWAAGETARHFGREDPGQAVIDEVAGQLITLAGTGAGLWGACAGFVVFRALDVTKPWPARRLEHLPGGLGIMADDVMVAVYGWALMRVGLHLLGYS